MAEGASRDFPLEIGLFLLRLSLGAFFLVWSGDKIVNPGDAQGVFQNFYFSAISSEIAVALGITQTVIIIAFIAGAFRTLTYGAALLMHTVSTLSTWKHLLNPYAPDASMLFWAAVPVLFALLLLFLVRERDRLLSVSG